MGVRPPVIIVVPRLTAHESAVYRICRPASPPRSPRTNRPEVGGDRISRLHRVKQLCAGWLLFLVVLTSGSPSLHYFPCAGREGDLYRRAVECTDNLTAGIIYTRKVHSITDRNDIPLYDSSTSLIQSSCFFALSFLRYLRLRPQLNL